MEQGRNIFMKKGDEERIMEIREIIINLEEKYENNLRLKKANNEKLQNEKTGKSFLNNNDLSSPKLFDDLVIEEVDEESNEFIETIPNNDEKSKFSIIDQKYFDKVSEQDLEETKKKFEFTENDDKKDVTK